MLVMCLTKYCVSSTTEREREEGYLKEGLRWREEGCLKEGSRGSEGVFKGGVERE